MRLFRIAPFLICLSATLFAGCAQPDQPDQTAAEETSGDEAQTAKKPVADTPDVNSVDEPVVEADSMVPAEMGDTGEDDAEEEVEKLAVGDPAPALKISSWLLGDKVESFAEDQVYVVEFWATWCGPCTSSMPHLSQLQQEYGDQVRMIGISDESDQTVNSFLDEEHASGKPWRDVIQYAIAIDDDRSTNRAYMLAAQQRGIPTAFVVGRDGIVEWVGHPMAMDEPLEKIVAGNWDRAAALVAFEQEQRINKAMPSIIEAMQSEDWDQALKIVEGLMGESQPSPRLSFMRISILQSAGRHEEVAQLLPELVEQQWDQAHLLRGIAWLIANGDEPRDLDLGLKAVKRASELTHDKDPAVLHTVARVYYEQGNLDEAIAWQKKAAAVGADIGEIAETLKNYEEEKAGDENTKPEDSEDSGSQSESTKEE